MRFSVFGMPLDEWDNGGRVDIYSPVVSRILVLLEVAPILRNGYEN